MRHIKEKSDWLYELRPSFLVAIGIVGVLSQLGPNFFTGLSMVCQACSMVLLFCAYKITHWRKEYRKNLL